MTQSRKVPLKAIEESKEEIAKNLQNTSSEDTEKILSFFKTTINGLDHKEVLKRLHYYGLNEVTPHKQKPLLLRFLLAFNNPLILLLLFLVGISFVTGGVRTGC